MSIAACERSLVARAPDDTSLAVDVDPDHAAVLNELEARRVAVELRPEIVGAAHERNHPALQLRKGHRTTLTHSLERPICIARGIGQRGYAGQRGGDYGRKKGTEQGHNATLVERAFYTDALNRL